MLPQGLSPGHSEQSPPRSGNSSAQTSASLHPPAALRLRCLPFTRDMGSTVCAEEFPTPLEASVCQMRLLPGQGRRCWMANAAAA